ncbi:MAG: AAA family ATPase [Alphaproteobacteria bacterium]|nr:AAA family ATPase [Alphaproteobacteria bacterium]
MIEPRRDQFALALAVTRVRHILAATLARRDGEDEPTPPTIPTLPDGPTTRLDQVASAFGLSPFERAVLVLCSGVEIDGQVPTICAALQGDARRAHASLGVAIEALPGGDWASLTPDAPLRRWRLVHLADPLRLTTAALRIDERVLHHLMGVDTTAASLAPLVEPLVAPRSLPPSHARLRDALIRRLDVGQAVVQLCGPPSADLGALFAATCQARDLRALYTKATMLPTAPADLDELRQVWEREHRLNPSGLLIDGLGADARALERAVDWTSRTDGFCVIAHDEPLRPGSAAVARVDVGRPTVDEQRALWVETLGQKEDVSAEHVDALVSNFDLGAAGIRAVCAMRTSEPQEDQAQILWTGCRALARGRLDDLAQRITPRATWADLVLPDPQVDLLREIVTQVRCRSLVYDRWGFSRSSGRGLGISALFAGTSGTGKTMAGEVLAGELQLDLYRIDLSSVVSKYIGETEKNLRRVFDAAEQGGAILLFDEADALFGKRSEVKDSHDRFANIEVSYLLQRMEAYRGLAILTTNLKKAIDEAFLRRLRFVVDFPFPDQAARARIWSALFPPELPTLGLDMLRLSQLNVAGGNIRNIAMNAAFLAAGSGGPLRMRHLARAARTELRKIGRNVADSELQGWT